MNKKTIKLLLFLALSCIPIQGIAQQDSKFEILLGKEMLESFGNISFRKRAGAVPFVGSFRPALHGRARGLDAATAFRG